MMFELLPCPFCGKKPEFDDEDVCYPSGIVWEIHPTLAIKTYFSLNTKNVPPEQWCYEINCVSHHGGCGANITGDSKQEVIDKWNKRS